MSGWVVLSVIQKAVDPEHPDAKLPRALDHGESF
jgi:hypothetical protein